MTVRRAGPEDAPAIAAIYVTAWHETYTGLLPDTMISALTVEVRQAWWAQLLSNPPATRGGAAYLAALDGTPVGFGTCNAQRSDVLAAAGFDGEISSLYVLRAAQGRGAGRALMARMATRLLRAEYRAAGLWVLRENASGRRFYEGCGGALLDGDAGLRVQGRFTEVALWLARSRAAHGPRTGSGLRSGRLAAGAPHDASAGPCARGMSGRRAPQRMPAPTTPASTARERRSVTAHSTPTPATGRTAMSWRVNGSVDGVGPTRRVSWSATAPPLA